MGYVHDTAMALAVHPNECMYSAGTWTDTETGVADVWARRRTAANATANVRIPIKLFSNAAAMKGCYLKSIDIFYEITTEAFDAVAATVYKTVFPADGAAFAAATSIAFTYDAGHDAAAERIDVDQHTMTLTITTPFWIDDGEMVFVELALDGNTNGVFDFLGARANFTLRA